MATVTPDHTTSQADVLWRSLGSQVIIIIIPLVSPQGVFWPFVAWQGQQIAVCKSRPCYLGILSLSGLCLSVAIIISNKIGFQFLCIYRGFFIILASMMSLSYITSLIIVSLLYCRIQNLSDIMISCQWILLIGIIKSLQLRESPDVTWPSYYIIFYTCIFYITNNNNNNNNNVYYRQKSICLNFITILTENNFYSALFTENVFGALEPCAPFLPPKV